MVKQSGQSINNEKYRYQRIHAEIKEFRQELWIIKLTMLKSMNTVVIERLIFCFLVDILIEKYI